MTPHKSDAGPAGATSTPAGTGAPGLQGHDAATASMPPKPSARPAFPDFLPEIGGGRLHSILFLQGLATPFFRNLAKRLKGHGHSVHRVNFCPGDWIFGPLFGGFRDQSTNYRGTMEDLPAFYRRIFTDRKVDTLLLFGDCRPIHTVAVKVAKDMGVRVLVFEEGYTRPGWVTMEEDGTNSFSRLPATAGAIRVLAQAKGITGPAGDVTIKTDMFRRAWMDVANHAVNIFFGRLFFPHYRGHRSVPLSTEAKGWARRLFLKGDKAENTATLRRYEAEAQDYFLVPLQLNTDYQIRVHSDFPDVPSFLKQVLSSFAAHADKGVRLFIKNHPLDNGTIPYRQIITEEATRLGIGGRVDFARGGDLNQFLKDCRGVVLINSTVGYAALKTGKPMKVLGRALYDIKGLTDQKPLDAFWAAPEPPEHSLAQAFLGVIQTYTQIRGDFFSLEGSDIAANGAMDVIEGIRPRLPEPEEKTTGPQHESPAQDV